MQKPSPPPTAPSSQQDLRARREDQEFLPAALEILETPPSPIRIAFLIFICALVVVSLAWAYFGTIDIIATAQGKIQPPGRVKVIQPVEAGKVARIHASNGAHVKEGDILIELDTTEIGTDVAALRAALAASHAEILRRDAVIEAMRALSEGGIAPKGEARIAWSQNAQGHSTDGQEGAPPISAAIKAREESVLQADLAQSRAQLGAIDAQTRQKEAEKSRLKDVIGAQGDLVATLKERVEMRSTLANMGSGSRASLIDARETLQTQQTLLVGQIAQSRETDAAIHLLTRERERAIQTFLSENTQKRAEALRLVDELVQRLAKSENRLANMVLRAPNAGIVQASAIYTQGQVITAGQEIMRLVPQGETLEVEAYLPNKDIGFVRLGAQTTVKIDSFPYTRFGIVTGHVSEIARDAIPHAEIGQIEGDPTKASETKSFAGAQRIQNLVFPITVTLEKSSLLVEGRITPLSPGMTVTVEVKTGRRRILEYLFSPLVETTSEAMRER